MVLCARLVDGVDANPDVPPPADFRRVFDDAFAAAENCYCQDHFELRCGGFFERWRSRIDDYTYACSDRVRRWLLALRGHRNGAQVFLLSSSRADYAEESMRFVLGDDWRSLFDVVVTDARKPGFFRKSRPFFDASGRQLTDDEAENLSATEIYAQGNATQLMASLEKLTGKKNPKVHLETK